VTATRPVPVPDEQSGQFWAAAAEHVLTVACCARCGALSLPPDVVCPHCGSTDPEFAFTQVSGDGAIRSWTIVRQAFLPGFDDDVPFMLVDVELAEQPGLRMIGRLLDGVEADVRIGAAVVADFEDLTPEVAVPAFRLAR